MNSVLNSTTRKGDWLQTYSGVAFWPFDPRPDEVYITDIAHALSMLCRYGGHCRKFYSVAEHCVHVANLCSSENKKWGLLHDATEAYLVDLPRPIKWHLPEYKVIEAEIEKVIATRFNLSLPVPQEVKQIDDGILACERDQIMCIPPYDWQVRNFRVDVTVQCWTPEKAKEEFMRLYWIVT